jgi:putative chitinase
MDAKAFFDSLRPDLYRGAFDQAQVDGLNAVLAACLRFKAPLREAAYAFATGYWETGGKLQPVEENLNYSAKRLTQVWPKRFPSLASAKPYANNPKALAEKVYGGRLGNDRPGDGWLFRGRNLPQATGGDLYKRLGFYDNPDDFMDLQAGADALVRGLLEGFFTGVSVRDFESYRDKRAAINADKNTRTPDGSTHGTKIAEIAEDFERALRAAGYPTVFDDTPVEEPAPSPQPDDPVVDPAPEKEPVTGIRWGRIAVAVAVVLALVWWLFF